MDSKIRHGKVELPVSTTNDNITPGTEIVGNVRKCGDAVIAMYGINRGDTIASLVGCGGNAKYINLDADQLVKVPRGVAAISAAIVIESYLPAFQALLLRVPKTHRYTSSALNGKGVLIFGGITTVGQALIELSLLLGASEVYTTATIKHHELLESIGAIPLELDPESWPQDINEKIDIAVDPSNFVVDKASFKAINQDGKLVCFGTELEKNAAKFSTFSDLFDSKNMKMKTHMYNVFDEWKVDLEGSKSDLSYLFGLLKLTHIDPQLAGTLRLSKVPEAHIFLDGKKRIQGTFVCLPFAEN
jgi:NADPH:quinone reductase-like Zn-dependent oxidoreductase